MKSSRIIVSGYYGYNNIGDEAILRGLIDGLRELDSTCNFTVLSKHPAFTSSKYNVDSIDRMDYFKIFRAMTDADLFISGGGSLLQDVTSKKSILYYLSLIWMARIKKLKTAIYSQGIGPIRNKINRFLTKKTLNSMDIINVRDRASQNYVSDLGVSKEAVLSIDSVFGIKRPSLDIGAEILKKNVSKLDKPIVGINILDWKETGYKTVNEFEFALKKILKKDVFVVLLPLYYYRDLSFQRVLYDRLKSDFDNIYLFDEYLSIDECLSLIGNFDIMISMRLHGLIFSTLMNTVPIGVSYDPKIDGFMSELNREKPIRIEDISGEYIVRELETCLSSLDFLKEQTRLKCLEFQERSKIHNLAIIELLNNK